MEKAMVSLINVVKDYGGQGSLAVDDVSMDIKEGEFLTILGPSGCGKTTTLRMVAGFENPDNGSIVIDGETVDNVLSYKRCVNTVFQNYALFPHMSVYDNIAFGLRMKKLPERDVDINVKKAINMVRLEGFEKRMPKELSGGQKQRVAIARAVVNNPKVLLLDEPLSALDYKLRKEMQIELKHLQRELGITFIFVTHDQEEALTMSDRIAVMKEGKLEQIGTPNEIYEHPRTKFVADFIGETNLFKGKVLKGESSETLVDISVDKIPVKNCYFNEGDEVYLAIRPEKLELMDKAENGQASLKVSLKERIYTGSSMKTIVTSEDGKEILINEPAGKIYKFITGNNAYVAWNPDCAVVLK
ncbi:MAG: ABC transporter ATP-binding protein [Bacillota bacterium]|nr:ABC transporter ATP-binding protein [Bacillota bacterium]